MHKFPIDNSHSQTLTHNRYWFEYTHFLIRSIFISVSFDVLWKLFEEERWWTRRGTRMREIRIFFSSPLSGITRCFSYDYFSFVVDSHVTRWLKSCLKWWNAINATLLIIIIGMMKKKRRLPIAHFYIHLNLYAHRTHICCFFLSFIWFLLFGINWCWSLRIVYFISIGGCIFFSLHSSLLFSFVSLFVFI